MKRNSLWKDVYSEEVIREKIVENHNEEMEIEELASVSGYHAKSVGKIIRNFRTAKNFKRRKGAGRPEILIHGDKVAISNCVRSKPWLATRKLKNVSILM